MRRTAPTPKCLLVPGCLAVVAIVLLIIQVVPLPAQTPASSLPFSRGFLITGDYVVGGVDLREDTHIIQNGFSTAPITMSGVPANADILAAYLYWETVTTGGDAWKTEAAGVQFRGFDLDVTNVLSVKRTTRPAAGAACFASGSLEMHMFRADVLRFLPIRVDSADKPTGKRIVNSEDLTAQGLAPHTVTLPVRNENYVPETAGASLLVVYRDPDPNAQLRKVVIYDGNVIKPDTVTPIDLTLKGFYGSATTRSAKITHLVSSGQPSDRLRFSFAGAADTAATTIGNSPFSSGPASQRWWANPTFDVSALMDPGTYAGPYGETVQTQISHSPTNGAYDCVALGAVVFSTAVADVDADGLPDALENRASPLQDANDALLPNLNAMGANSSQKDIFIEVNAMVAEAGTSYGSVLAPYSVSEPVKVDPDGHNHLPTPYALKLVGEAFAAHDIRVHFDVGDVGTYHALGVVNHPDFVDDYTSTEADTYLIPSESARGGEVITETACDPGKPACHFPDYPGTVPWKLGLQAHRDAPVDDAGIEIVPTTQNAASVSFHYRGGAAATWNGRRRFDPERHSLFKYLLYAHARGNPKSLPCIVGGQPAPYLEGLDTDTPSCGTGNPDVEVNESFNVADYHVPTSASGVAELPGGNFMVTMGFWDNFVGRPFARASTTFHELGHTLGLYHSGPETERAGTTFQPGAVIWGNATTATWIEANCKPNYLSSMSYLFQVHGLFDDADQLHLDFSWTARNALNEASLSDGELLPRPLSPVPNYQTAWFAPADSPLAIDLGVTAAKRYCNGTRFGISTPAPAMARVHADTATSAIDWDGNPATLDAANYDANFNNAVESLDGFSDWDNIRVNQTGAVITGVTAGSAEGVFFDNSGTANGVFFDNSGVFFDQSGVWFDNSGVWFDNSGGVFFDNSGVFFDNSGVFFDNSGVWFDNAGGVWFDNAGGVFFDNAGGVFFDNAGGVFFDNSGQELTYEEARSAGRGRPHRVATCVIDETNKFVTQQPDTRTCSTAAPNTPRYDRVEVQFEQLQVGGISVYEIQRMSPDALAGTPDADFATAGSVAAHLVRFTDLAELANGKQYTYRVRGLTDDEFGNSGWSRLATETAVNQAPSANDDGPFSVGTSLAIGVLENDTDVDSPPASITVLSVTDPPHGTAVVNANGSITYTPDAGYVGPDSFTYAADNGPWSGDPLQRLSPSDTATVSVIVLDTTPPTLSLPANITVGAFSATGAAVTYSPLPSATDAVSGPSIVTCSRESASTFPIGTTTVTCSASDVAGNTANGSFTVTVILISGTATASPATLLWSPNRTMTPVTISGRITTPGLTRAYYTILDEYGLLTTPATNPPGVTITSVNSTTGDYSFVVILEAYRNGNDSDGRLYTITVRGVNAAGQVVTAATTVRVPHNQ